MIYLSPEQDFYHDFLFQMNFLVQELCDAWIFVI